MKFKKIGELTYDSKLEWGTDAWEAQHDALSNYKAVSDLAIAIDAAGNKALMAQENMNNGLCDCCTDYKRETVAYEFYKLEEEINE